MVNESYSGRESSDKEQWATLKGNVSIVFTREMMEKDYKDSQGENKKFFILEHVLECDGGVKVDENQSNVQPQKVIAAVVKIDRESVNHRTGVIGLVCVNVDYQGQGLGNIVMQIAEEQAMLWNFENVVLRVVSNRDSLLQWYYTLGYQQKGTKEEWNFPTGFTLHKPSHITHLIKYFKTN
ncbi:hypothetical protein DLAC_02232 [Tieghemostelium lacteum]|uniref:N-acetyltransferase domain-containing protein n=1 Tax=Tieghemostelium lacteum TaxID=361077 RepID=A0A152A4F6_TIELA|nr:hypothetical protein DLAC_02232 [Tieghemostelium lacteum]|eukprot:KYR01128.1 hypothetical protein DLAC_02232 [Tieghemostelium lacteum]